MKSAKLRYSITSNDLSAHLFHVTLSVDHPQEEGQIFSLPVWIPGSYMVREFARHIVQIHASCQGRAHPLKKLDKNTWQAAPCNGPLVLTYQVYAWDLSVRAAHLDRTHGFFNGTSVFLQAHGLTHLPHQIEIVRPKDVACQAWRVATSLSELKAKRYGFGTYIARDYDELIDHPVEMGEFGLVQFEAHGVVHDFVLTGQVPQVDLPRIAFDLKKICETEIAFFEPRSKRAPMQRYVFLTMAVNEGYGGLEHRASTALLCSRADLPTKNKPQMSEAYRAFLALCSHEYFHTWNVKRIKPQVFCDYDLNRENDTQLLWFFEGITSYYDDLFVRRAGLIDEACYLKLISKTMNTVLRGSGRKKQSVAQSSMDAWTKYYRQDENSPNAIVSYYAKGALIGLGLDLTIRQQTEGKKSLDDVMRVLWRRFGKDFYEGSRKQVGVQEDALAAIIETATGVDVRSFLKKYVLGVEDVPLATLYADFGVEVIPELAAQKLTLGARLIKSGSDCKLSQVFEGGAAHRAGLSAGDVLVAVDALRVSAPDAQDQLQKILTPYEAGQKIKLHYFRRDELHMTELRLLANTEANFSCRVTEPSPRSDKAKAPLGRRLRRPSV